MVLEEIGAGTQFHLISGQEYLEIALLAFVWIVGKKGEGNGFRNS